MRRIRSLTRRKVTIIPLSFLLLSLMGCAARSVPLTPIQKFAVASKDFSASVEAFQLAEIEFFNQGHIKVETHVKINKVVIDVATAGLELNNAILVTKSEPDMRVALAEALASTEGLLKDLRALENSNIRTQLLLAVTTARSFLAIIATQIGGSDGTDITSVGSVAPSCALPLLAVA